LQSLVPKEYELHRFVNDPGRPSSQMPLRAKRQVLSHGQGVHGGGGGGRQVPTTATTRLDAPLIRKLRPLGSC